MFMLYGNVINVLVTLVYLCVEQTSSVYYYRLGIMLFCLVLVVKDLQKRYPQLESAQLRSDLYVAEFLIMLSLTVLGCYIGYKPGFWFYNMNRWVLNLQALLMLLMTVTILLTRRYFPGQAELFMRTYGSER